MNKILTAITNRTSFATPMFYSAAQSLLPFPSEAEKLRQLLQLDYTGSDYYVVGALAAIEAFPALKECFGADDVSYRLRDFTRPSDQWLGVVPTLGHDAPAVHRDPQAFPVSFIVQFSFVDVNTMLVTEGTKRTLVPVRVADAIMEPQWPAELGIVGALDLQFQTWGSTFAASLTSTPASFPYATVAAQLDEDKTKNSLLLTSGLLLQYMRATDPVEKVATCLLALGLANPNFVWK